ncbi:MAG: hypothetical protein D6690_04270 [Nitrospirae bacterium]|nr:MAG: hypothetical protein D6690_04270 [Nitrospirota bacterium]
MRRRETIRNGSWLVQGGIALAAGMVLSGCQLWPFMSAEDGRRPIAMGKHDQILYPYTAPPTVLSEDFGQAFRSARENQILHPEASSNLEPLRELHGGAARHVIDGYESMFEKPPFITGAGAKSGGGK